MLAFVLTGFLISALLGCAINPVGERPRVPDFYTLCSGTAWWMAFFSVGCLLSQRPYFAVTLVVVLHAVLIAVNHTKYKALKEPFILQDFEYFTDALRHPRLYIPFFGIMKTLALLAAGATAIGLFFWLEAPLYRQGADWWRLPIGAMTLALVTAGLAWGNRPRLSLDPVQDIRGSGLIALLHSHLAEYWLARRRELVEPAADWPLFATGKALPNLVMVQSESFFDPRRCYPFVGDAVLQHWDRMSADAAARGALQVPAWGANTVRTEAAVLTGLSPDALGIHRYNPYRRLSGNPVRSLATHLRDQGYRTICVHPYPAHFYQRDRVLPALGFDQFIDMAAFANADCCGQYVGDLAVADKVQVLLGEADQPVFVFVITMENHGPLHLEQPDETLASQLYLERPSGPLRDLTTYLGHLRNADAMLAQLIAAVQATDSGGSVCWYGDHVPIMPDVYRHFGEPDETTPWLIWSDREGNRETAGQVLSADRLAARWLDVIKECHRI